MDSNMNLNSSNGFDFNDFNSDSELKRLNSSDLKSLKSKLLSISKNSIIGIVFFWVSMIMVFPIGIVLVFVYPEDYVVYFFLSFLLIAPIVVFSSSIIVVFSLVVTNSIMILSTDWMDSEINDSRLKWSLLAMLVFFMNNIATLIFFSKAESKLDDGKLKSVVSCDALVSKSKKISNSSIAALICFLSFAGTMVLLTMLFLLPLANPMMLSALVMISSIIISLILISFIVLMVLSISNAAQILGTDWRLESLNKSKIMCGMFGLLLFMVFGDIFILVFANSVLDELKKNEMNM